MTDLGTLGGSSEAFGINDSGQVVGDSFPAAGSRPFLYTNGSMQDLNSFISPSSGWVLAYAARINDSGQIIGTGSLNGQGNAFLYTDGVATSLGSLGGGTMPQGLNDKGQVVGTSYIGNTSRAFLYSGGMIQDLNSLIDPSSGWVLETGESMMRVKSPDPAQLTANLTPFFSRRCQSPAASLWRRSVSRASLLGAFGIA